MGTRRNDLTFDCKGPCRHFPEQNVNNPVKTKASVDLITLLPDALCLIQAIAALDADVITIETSRSNMELLEAFVDFKYPNEIGPGVYDIHSPRVPTVEEMETLMARAAQVLPVENLWVNPDCGLKTRGWAEVKSSLANMVTAARRLRERFALESNSSSTTAKS